MKSQECEQIYREEFASAKAFGESEFKTAPRFSVAWHADTDGTVESIALHIDFGKWSSVQASIYDPTPEVVRKEWRELVKLWAQKQRDSRA